MSTKSVAADFYVSTDGNDSFTGTVAEPNTAGTDGPFATINKARDAVRDLKSSDSRVDIKVLIRGGTYRLTETVVFGLNDGAPDGGTITYAAYPGEKPVFSSGVPIENWCELGHEVPAGLSEYARPKVWVADIPVGLDRFHVLYDGERRLPRSRTAGFAPTQPHLHGSDEWADDENDPMYNTVAFPAGCMRSWENIDDVEIIIRPNFLWTMNILPLSDVDEKSCTARTTIPGTYPLRQVPIWHEKRPMPESVWVENVLEGIRGPEQWAVDTHTRKIYLWPMGDAPGSSSCEVRESIVAPCLTELFRVEGNVDIEGPVDTPVTGLNFKGLTFSHADRGTWEPGDAGIQHDWEMIDKSDALIRFRGAEDCSVTDCTFTRSGGSAVRLDLHCQRNEVSRNEIHHLGGGGIHLIGYGPGTKDVNKQNRLYDNHIHHCGEIYWHSHGIIMWQSGENTAAHNTIHHMPRKAFCLSGVRPWYFDRSNFRSRQRECGRSVRWHEIDNVDEVTACGHEASIDMGRDMVTWEPLMPYLHCRNNIIEENDVHRVNQVLGDGSSINVSGAGEGNTIRRNFVHDIYNPYIHGAIRTDDFQRGTLIEENIIFRTNSAGLCLRHENYAINNYVIDVRPDNYVWVGFRPFDGTKIVNNIFFHPGKMEHFYVTQGNIKKPVLQHLGDMKSGKVDGNLYFATSSKRVDGDLTTLKQLGHENVGIYDHPGFSDWERGDFALAQDSPAVKLGIKQIDLSDVGVRHR